MQLVAGLFWQLLLGLLMRFFCCCLAFPFLPQWDCSMFLLWHGHTLFINIYTVCLLYNNLEVNAIFFWVRLSCWAHTIQQWHCRQSMLKGCPWTSSLSITLTTMVGPLRRVDRYCQITTHPYSILTAWFTAPDPLSSYKVEIYFKREKYSASDGILRPHWVYDLEMKQGGLLTTWQGTQAIKLVFLWLTIGRGNGQVKMNSVMLYFAVCTVTIFFLGGSWWYCQQMRTIILSWERVQLTAFPWNMLQDFFQCWVEYLSRVDYAWARWRLWATEDQIWLPS